MPKKRKSKTKSRKTARFAKNAKIERITPVLEATDTQITPTTKLTEITPNENIRSNNILALLVIVALAFSLAGTFFTINKLYGTTGGISGLITGVANVTVSTSTSISMLVGDISFGNLTLNAQNTTDTNNPPPFVVKNDGSVFVNVTISATNIFQVPVANNPGNYYWFRSAENETGSVINTSADLQVAYKQMPNSSAPSLVVTNFNYNDTNDTVRVHINITVPSDEPAGSKSSTVTFTAAQS